MCQQDLLSMPRRPKVDSGLSLTRVRAASGGARSSGSVYSQGSAVLCDTTNAGRPPPRHTNFYMPPVKAVCPSGFHSLYTLPCKLSDTCDSHRGKGSNLRNCG